MVGATGFMVTPVRVSGRVVDVHGRPVPDAEVTLVAGGDTGTHTADDGSFHLAGGYRIEGYAVEVSAPGFISRQAQGSGSLVLQRAPIVQGRVVDEAGNGVAGAWIAARALTGRTSGQTVTDADGFFWLTGLHPGLAEVTVVAPEHDGWQSRVELAADHIEQLAPIAARQFGVLDLATSPAGVAPTLDGAPIPGCPATPCVVSVLAGDHVVAVDSPIYVPWSQAFSLVRNQRLAVSTTLQPRLGVLAVTAPGGNAAELLIDGNAVGAGGW
ncbi:MAG TPA: carboxypeptidase regulatory-like domain-containing protein, partial [Candidatus Dormibacteraeota bacterium]